MGTLIAGSVQNGAPVAPDGSVSTMMPVLIVEDHPLVAAATAELLAGCGGRIRPVVCVNAEQTIEKLDEHGKGWFKIFLDLGVPGAYGLSLAREVHRRGLGGRCCVVSAFEQQEYLREIKRMGFLGYVFKSTPVTEFTHSLKLILEGQASYPTAPVGERAPALRLTRRQIEILEELRLGLSSKEIAARLCLTEGTVNNYVAAILQVFDAGSRAHAVAKAIELGLIGSLPALPRSGLQRVLRSG